MFKVFLTIALLAPLSVMAQDFAIKVSKKGSFSSSSEITANPHKTRSVMQLIKEDKTQINVVNPELTLFVQLKARGENRQIVFGAGSQDDFLINAINGDCIEAKELALAETSTLLCGLDIKIKKI